ncbi:MAG TPA: citryl-CoA lyase [Pseudonocardia sp.]|nr:citryl-CoA lyase [Pseudonocardia sp.]
MARSVDTLRSDIAWSTKDRISVRDHDLVTEILGHMSLSDFSYLQITGRAPTPDEGRVYNAILMTLVEHGLTPSALAARLTFAGAPEALQSAVAAGLCGLGSVFVGSTETSARMMTDVLPLDSKEDADLDELALKIVATYRERGAIVPGIGHPIHKPIDPRTPRLFEIAEESGFSGRYVQLVQKVAAEASSQYGKDLPVNATGAIGALSSELGFPWTVIRGFGVMARAIGLVGHLLEESHRPLALEVWRRAEEESSRHARPDA